MIDAIVRNKAVTSRQWEEREPFFQNASFLRKSLLMMIWGTEAIRKLTVKDFPAIVVIDSEGHNLYETAIKDYKK